MENEINALSRAEKEEILQNSRGGANKLLSAILFSSIVGLSGFCYHQNNKLAQTESNLEETTKKLISTKKELENAIYQGEKNYEVLLRDVVRSEIVSFPWHIQFEDNNFYAKAISKLVLGRDPAVEEFEIIFDEIKKTENERYKTKGAR